ncbi:MAG: hypothetical protein JWO44_1409 [Bacteroidetes bacterium]|nr:hypothetical protein [Bacteroidota bacterium]
MLALTIQVMSRSQTAAKQFFQGDKNFVLGYTNYTEEERREFAGIDDPAVLLIQADELTNRAMLEKKTAAGKRGEEQVRLLNNVNELLHKAETRRLAASELLGYNNRMEFKLMKAACIELLCERDATDSLVILAKKALLNAVRSYRLGIELREEAYAQRTIEATLGNLHLAEEKESIAIIKVVQAMKLLEEVTPQVLAIR